MAVQQPGNRAAGAPARTSRVLLAALLLVMAVLAVYGRVLSAGFQFVNFDDDDYVVQNPGVRGGLSAEGLRWALTTTQAFNWHPLTWLSLQLDASLWGLDPRGYHLTNLLLHAANTLLLFVLLWRMTGALWRSFFLAALFGVHPLHVESVAWVAERKDVLSTFFWMLTTSAYVTYVRRPGLLRYLLVVLWFSLGLMAKPMLVTLPATLLLLDYWPLGRFAASAGGARKSLVGKLIAEKLPLFALAAASSVITVISQQGVVKQLVHFPLHVRIMNALVAYVTYLAKTFWPTRLGCLYPHPGDQLPPIEVALAALVLLGVTAAALALARQRPYIVVGWFWYLGTLVPVIGLVQVGVQAMADRYTYVPLIGIFVILAWGLPDLLGAHWSRLVPSLGAAALVAYAVLAFAQVGTWRNSRTLWQQALAVTSDNPVAHYHLALALSGQPGESGAVIRHYEAAVRLFPSYAPAHNNLGRALLGIGQIDRALKEIEEATRLAPGNANAFYNLGVAWDAKGDTERALRAYDETLRIDPSYGNAWNNRGVLLERKGDLAGALDSFRQAVQLRADAVPYLRNLAYLLYESGRTAEADALYRELLQGDTGWPAALAREAWSLATHPDPRARNAALAVRGARQACQATRFQDFHLLDILAAAYAAAGRFDGAVATARKALELSNQQGNAQAAAAIQQRLALYEKHEPYHSPPPANRGRP
jgi:tetratricopeptide (TPR) repeat protein